MTPEIFRGMRAEIEKGASLASLATRGARFLTKSPARTAAIGAAGGAAAGGYQEHRRGGSVLGGALRGGILGAAAGGAAGGAGRVYRDVRLLDPKLTRTQAVGAAVKRMGRGVKQFGQRQVHGITGAYSKTPGKIGLRSSATSKKKIDLAKLRLQDELKFAKTPEKQEALRKSFQKTKAGLIEEGKRGDESIRAGVTSLPGIAKGLARDPRRTAKAMWRETTGGGGLGGTAMAVGLPVATMVPELARGDESATGGKSMRQKLVELGTITGGGIATAGLPIVPMMAAGLGIDAAGQAVARRFEKKRRPPPEASGA